MFTGLIEATGVVAAAEPFSSGRRLSIRTDVGGEGTKLGDSIAVNGVCLTVTVMEGTTVTFDVSPETLQHSTLGRLKRGDEVNLERALRLSDRLGGHLVTGHIDGTGSLVAQRPRGEFTEFSFRAGPEILDYSAPKGSVAVDGISLTIADLSNDGFTVAVIPHTAARTTLAGARPGTSVNLEADILGKYVARMLERRSGLSGDRHFLQRLQEEGFMS